MKVAAPLILAAVLAGSGIFFLTQDLGHADQYASVASFLLALTVAGFTLIAYFRGQNTARQAEAATINTQNVPESSKAPSGRTIIYKPRTVFMRRVKKAKLIFFHFFH
jgi:hypothetical protein